MGWNCPLRQDTEKQNLSYTALTPSQRLEYPKCKHNMYNNASTYRRRSSVVKKIRIQGQTNCSACGINEQYTSVDLNQNKRYTHKRNEVLKKSKIGEKCSSRNIGHELRFLKHIQHKLNREQIKIYNHHNLEGNAAKNLSSSAIAQYNHKENTSTTPKSQVRPS